MEKFKVPDDTDDSCFGATVYKQQRTSAVPFIGRSFHHKIHLFFGIFCAAKAVAHQTKRSFCIS